MDKDLKKKWVKALRSGNYTQGKHFLYSVTNKAHCCLGVLCEIQGLRFDQEHQAYLSESDEWVGTMTMHIPGGPTHDVANELAMMNDQGDSFDHIADFIEKTDM